MATYAVAWRHENSTMKVVLDYSESVTIWLFHTARIKPWCTSIGPSALKRLTAPPQGRGPSSMRRNDRWGASICCRPRTFTKTCLIAVSTCRSFGSAASLRLIRVRRGSSRPNAASVTCSPCLSIGSQRPLHYRRNLMTTCSGIAGSGSDAAAGSKAVIGLDGWNQTSGDATDDLRRKAMPGKVTGCGVIRSASPSSDAPIGRG
jgi:hypothetical protein